MRPSISADESPKESSPRHRAAALPAKTFDMVVPPPHGSWRAETLRKGASDGLFGQGL
jgi:hypothetical protein